MPAASCMKTSMAYVSCMSIGDKMELSTSLMLFADILQQNIEVYRIQQGTLLKFTARLLTDFPL